MSKTCIAATMLMCAAAATAEPAAALGLVHMEDHQYPEGTFARNAKWLGLFCEQMICELRDAKVRIKTGKVKDMEDQDEAVDLFEPEGNPQAVFSGTRLAAGKVSTWYVSPDKTGESAAASRLRALGRWSMPGGAVALTISWVKLPDDKGFRYHLSDGVTQQFLFALPARGDYGNVNYPVIRWVGDLDNDGKMDMLVSLPDDCKYDQRLYLSSLAAKGEFVAKAAALAGGSAACGC
jgi:hypothetical protein